MDCINEDIEEESKKSRAHD